MPKLKTVLLYVFPPFLFGLYWLFKRSDPPPKRSVKEKEEHKEITSNHQSQKLVNHSDNVIGKQSDEHLTKKDADSDEIETKQSVPVRTAVSKDGSPSDTYTVEKNDAIQLLTNSFIAEEEKIENEQSLCSSKPSCIEDSIKNFGSEIVSENHIVENGDYMESHTNVDNRESIESEIIEEVIQKSTSSVLRLNATQEIVNSSTRSSHDLISTSNCQNDDTNATSDSGRHCIQNSIDSVIENNLLNDIESQIILSSQNSSADVVVNGIQSFSSDSIENSVLNETAKNKTNPDIVNNKYCSNNSGVERVNQVLPNSNSHSSDSSTSVLKSDSPVTIALDSRTSSEQAHDTKTVEIIKHDIDQLNISNNNSSPTSLSHSNQHVQNSQQESSSLTPEQQKSSSSPESSSYDSNSEASNDSGKGASVTEPPGLIIQNEITIYEFNFPSDLCGRLIGRFGKNINSIKDQSGATLSVRNNPYTPAFQICAVEGTQSEIDTAIDIVKKKFPRSKFPNVDLSPINQSRISDSPLLMPEIMQMNLPEGVSVDVLVSSIVNAGQIFIQQPTHPSFPSLERLNHFMVGCYSQEGAVPPLPRPIEVGVICAAPMMNGWFRAQVVSVYEETDECDIRYVDYGGYATVQSSLLKQIRSDFMSLPFQAVECYMGNITPSDDEEYFSTEAAAVLEELTQGKLLQAQVVARAEDSVPYVHVYQINGSRAVLINREMVNRGVARWVEVFS